MTPLRKPVTRVVDFGRGPVAVTLWPSGLITFREKGRRAVYAAPLSRVFIQAVDAAVSARRAAKARGRS